MYHEKDKKPLIVLLREDIVDVGLSLAQACHAAYEFGLENPEVQTNGYVYVLKADIKKLLYWEKVLSFEMTPFVLFREPDMNNEPTALCCSINPNRTNNLTKF